MSQKSSFRSIIESSTPVVIDFYADWCGPCKAFSPILKDLKAVYGEQIKIIKIDVDKNNRLAQQLEVQSIPTVMIFREGKLIWRAMGVQPLAALKQQLEPLL